MATRKTQNTGRALDPTGKGALFSTPVEIAPDLLHDGGRKQGKDSLYSTQPRSAGTFLVTCGSCEARVRTGAFDLAVRLVPSAWLPWRRHPHLITCPACGERSWVRIGLG